MIRDIVLEPFCYPVKVYDSEKANGENCQISYFKLEAHEGFIVCSKNVSIYLRDEKDIDLYHGDRFHFAKIIARQFF